MQILMRIIDGFLVFVMKAALRLSVAFGEIHKRMIGTCAFCGPDSFLDACESAVKSLRKYDEDMFLKLVRIPGLTFVYLKIACDGPSRNYTINQKFCAWSDHGIITRMVYAVYREDLCGGRSYIPNQERRIIRARAEALLFEWLKEHEFPQELVQLYSNPTSIGKSANR